MLRLNQNILRTNFPLVSIITPSFNQGKYLEKTILSVLNQSYTNIEYLIIDGGSGDESIDIIKKHENKLSYWCSEPDSGQADAINKGFEKAKGEFLCWVNSDDIIYPDFIKKRLEEFKQYPDSDMIYGDVEQGKNEIDKVIREGKQTNFTEMLKTGTVPIPQQSAIWKKSILKKTGGLNVKWKVLLDRDFFMRIAYFGNITYCKGTLGFFLNHDTSKSVVLTMEWVKELPLYYFELFNSFLPENYQKYKRISHANMHAYCAKITIQNRKFVPGIKHALIAFWLNPVVGTRIIFEFLRIH